MAQHAAAARQPLKIHRIGVLLFTSQALAIEELVAGTTRVGLCGGTKVYARGPLGRRVRGAPSRSSDRAVRLPVDPIVAHTTPAVRAAQLATTTIPIVAVVMTDPVRVGSADSLAYPGGNITGCSPRPEFEEPRHTSASSRRQNKDNQEELRLFCHQT